MELKDIKRTQFIYQSVLYLDVYYRKYTVRFFFKCELK